MNNKKHSRLITFCMVIVILSLGIVIASNTVSVAPGVSFEFNILTTIPEGSAIDTTAQTTLRFNLYEDDGEIIYYKNKPVTIIDDYFEIDLSGLHGETVFEFTNESNNTISFKYYLSDKNGYLKGYELVKNVNLKSYIETYNNIKIIYTMKEKDCVELLEEYLDMVPSNIVKNVNTIKMIPYSNTSNIAGVTKRDTITLYRFSKYSEQTQKNIIFHESAHTWANELMDKKIIDYDYTEYSVVASLDMNYVSSYSKRFTLAKGRYSEDFAESVAFYFINPNFSEVCPHRYEYISNLLAI